MDKDIILKWCMELGFRPEEAKDFCHQFTNQYNPGMGQVWKHIIQHVRPKESVKIIQKQYLLYLLRTSKHYQKLEVKINNLNDYYSYLKIKKKNETLKGIQDLINERKVNIMGYLTKLEVLRHNDLNDENELREKVYKLNQLKNKKNSVTKIIHKLQRDTKLMTILINPPNKIIGFSSAATDWEHQVLMTAKDIPHGIELQTIFLKFNNLLRESKLMPVPHWDRTELLTLMEKMLLSMIEKINSSRSALTKNTALVHNREKEVLSLISEKLDGELSEGEILRLFKEVKDNILGISEDIGKNLCLNKPPYTLKVEHYTLARLQRQIDGKFDEICSLMPNMSNVITDLITYNCPVIDLPTNHSYGKLINTISEEISLFMNSPNWILNPTLVEHKNIEMGCTSKSQYRKLQRNMDKLLKLLSLREDISNIILPPAGNYNAHDLKEKVSELCSDMNEYTQVCNELHENIIKTYKRLMSAFLFWRDEPLNQRLSGIEIAGEDISFWVSSYMKLKEQIAHEEWLLLDNLSVR